MPVLLVTILLSGMGFGLILPGFPFVAEKLGVPHWAGPMVLGLYAIGQFIATPFWGRYSDRFGRRPLLIGSIAGGMVGHLICAFAPDPWTLSFGRLLTGLMGGNIPVAMAYASDISPPEQRAKTLGIVGASLSLGFIVGPLVGGLLGGKDAASATLLWPGLAAALVCLLAITGAFFLLKESLPPEKRAVARPAGDTGGGFAAFRQVVQRPVLGQLLTVGFLAYLAMAAFETNFPFWAGDRFGWGPREIGLSFTYLAMLVVTTQGLLVGPLVKRFGEKLLLIAGLEFLRRRPAGHDPVAVLGSDALRHHLHDHRQRPVHDDHEQPRVEAGRRVGAGPGARDLQHRQLAGPCPGPRDDRPAGPRGPRPGRAPLCGGTAYVALYRDHARACGPGPPVFSLSA